MKSRVDEKVKDLNRRSDIAGENDATKPPNPGDKTGEAGAMEATVSQNLMSDDHRRNKCDAGSRDRSETPKPESKKHRTLSSSEQSPNLPKYFFFLIRRPEISRKQISH